MNHSRLATTRISLRRVLHDFYWSELGTLLHYLQAATPSQMYVSEVFKVVGGRIVRIDNIGVMMTGVSSLGFVH